MLVPRKNRIAVYTQLFREGVLAVKKDVFAPRHQQIEVPNLHVMKLMVEFKSKGFVTEVFSWQWYYYTLTPAGVEYLRNYLHLGADTVPNTHKKTPLPVAPTTYASSNRGDRSFQGRRGGASRGGDFSGRSRRQESN